MQVDLMPALQKIKLNIKEEELFYILFIVPIERLMGQIELRYIMSTVRLLRDEVP